jgi:hypothetical protein
MCIPFSIPIPVGHHFLESVEFRGISGFPSEHKSELNHSRARLIWSGIPDSGIPAGIP